MAGIDPNTTDTTQKSPKKKKLTLKQRIWIREFMTDGNQTRAALVAYFPTFDRTKEYSKMTEEDQKTYDKASTFGYQNIRKLEMSMSDLMDEAGISDAYLLQKVVRNIDVEKAYGKDADVLLIDGNASNKAVEIALKIKGKLIDRVDHTSKGETIAPLVVSDIAPRTDVTTQTESTENS